MPEASSNTMYIVFLRFGPHRAQAPQWMEAHNQWIQRGIDEGVFLLAGSLERAQGGALLAAHTTWEALQARIQEDPFVRHGVVEAEIHVISPSRLAPQLADVLGPLRASFPAA